MSRVPGLSEACPRPPAPRSAELGNASSLSQSFLHTAPTSVHEAETAAE